MYRCSCLLAVAMSVVLVNLSGCSSPAPSSAQDQAAPSSSAGARPAAKSPAAPEKAAPDVIVVGAGISGLATALDLGRGGARVTVVDMASVYGGHAVMSQGAVSIVATPEQDKAGIKDSPQLAFDDFHRWGETPNTPWVRYYVDHSRREIYDWLDELGVRYIDVWASYGNSVPREHRPVGRGIGLVTPIYRACVELPNVDFTWNGKVVRLLTEGGRVTGVVIRDMRTGTERELRAQAVVLATGGFQSNLDMVREFWPAEFRFPERILAGGGTNAVGYGHQLAQAVGGALAHMDYQWNYFTGLPDPRYPGTKRGLNATNLYGILVNSEAERFVNFHGWAKEVMPVLLKQDKVTCWNIFDESTKEFLSVSGSDWGDFKKVDRLILQNPALVKKADTLEELARLSGLPPQNLVETVARYNELVESGVDADFGRFGAGKRPFSNKASPKLVTPPFYAMQTWPLTRKSMGGVAIDLSTRVLDKQERPIPGLYAVGELAGLAGINGKAALEGTFLGPCIVTGRVAARSLLAELAILAGAAPTASSRCADCHDLPELLANPRDGYWHFEKVHRVVHDRSLDCRACHAELTPYREESHQLNRQILSASCVMCHVANTD